MSRISEKDTEKDMISDEIAMLVGGKRNRMKLVLSAIEKQFDGIKIICVDSVKDTVLFGFEYLEEQESIECEQQLGNNEEDE